MWLYIYQNVFKVFFLYLIHTCICQMNERIIIEKEEANKDSKLSAVDIYAYIYENVNFNLFGI